MVVKTLPDLELDSSEDSEDHSVDFGMCKKLPSAHAPSGGLAAPHCAACCTLSPQTPGGSGGLGVAFWGGNATLWPVDGQPAAPGWEAWRPDSPRGRQRGSCRVWALTPPASLYPAAPPGSQVTCVLCTSHRATACPLPRRQLYGWGYVGDHRTGMYPVKLSTAPQRP